MGLRKFGTGQVVGTEGPQAKTASKDAKWTENDERELRDENADDEGEH